MKGSTRPVTARLARWAPQLLASLRIVTALLFLQHALVKLVGFPPGAKPGQVPLASFLGAVGVFELVVGVLILVGLFTRGAAFLASGQMAVAYFLAHLPAEFFPILNGGEPAILYCFVFLYLAAVGPGAWSMDGSTSPP